MAARRKGGNLYYNFTLFSLFEEKDEFKEHVDVMDYASAKRFLVFFLYLNNNTGGLTEFPEYDTMITPKAGRLLMFPPLWTHKHIGHKPLEQPKYIVGSYLHYA